MRLENLIDQGKDKFFEIISNTSSSFPYANDIMHTSMIGSIPFLVGKYGSKLIGKKIPFFDKHSTAIGFASSALSEILWQTLIEPSSPFDHPNDIFSDYKGIGETALGAGLAYSATKLKKENNL